MHEWCYTLRRWTLTHGLSLLLLVSFTKHPSQTRTSCAIPKWGSAFVLDEHCWTNTCPQFRQWWFLFVKEKCVRQRKQRSESIHSGAFCVSTIAAFATARFSGGNLNLKAMPLWAGESQRNHVTYLHSSMSLYFSRIRKRRLLFKGDGPALY